MQLEYTIILVEINPETGTDYVGSRIELESCPTLREALQKQSQFLAMLRTKKNYRCYIVEREVYEIQITKNKTATKRIVKGIHNVVELPK